MMVLIGWWTNTLRFWLGHITGCATLQSIVTLPPVSAQHGSSSRSILWSNSHVFLLFLVPPKPTRLLFLGQSITPSCDNDFPKDSNGSFPGSAVRRQRISGLACRISERNRSSTKFLRNLAEFRAKKRFVYDCFVKAWLLPCLGWITIKLKQTSNINVRGCHPWVLRCSHFIYDVYHFSHPRTMEALQVLCKATGRKHRTNDSVRAKAIMCKEPIWCFFNMF